MNIAIAITATWFFISLILMAMETFGAIEINRPFEPVFFCLAAPAYVPTVFLLALFEAGKRICRKILQSEFAAERIRKRKERRYRL